MLCLYAEIHSYHTGRVIRKSFRRCIGRQLMGLGRWPQSLPGSWPGSGPGRKTERVSGSAASARTRRSSSQSRPCCAGTLQSISPTTQARKGLERTRHLGEVLELGPGRLEDDPNVLDTLPDESARCKALPHDFRLTRSQPQRLPRLACRWHLEVFDPRCTGCRPGESPTTRCDRSLGLGPVSQSSRGYAALHAQLGILVVYCRLMLVCLG